jgi:hypothetical protein
MEALDGGNIRLHTSVINGIETSSIDTSGELLTDQVTSPHFSPGSREQAQDSCSQAPLWSEKRSHSYGLSEEQAYAREARPEP